MSFKYNSSGLRTKKVVGDKTIEYYYAGDLLVAQYDGIEYMNFTYSPSGEPAKTGDGSMSLVGISI